MTAGKEGKAILALLQFDYRTIYDFKKGKITGEERYRAFKFLNMNASYAFEILRDGLYENDEEKTKLIKTVLLSEKHSYELITRPELKMLLSQDELQAAIWSAINDTYVAYKVLINYKELSEKQRIEALENTLLNRSSILNILIDIDTSENDRVYIISKVLDNAEIINDYIRLTYEKVRRHNKLNDGARKLAFKTFIEKKNNNYKLIFELVQRNYFYKEELEQIYELYHLNYYNNCKSKFYDYYDFCVYFSDWLHDEYKERMAKKLMTKSYSHNIKRAIESIKFPGYILDKFEAYAVAKKLTKI